MLALIARARTDDVVAAAVAQNQELLLDSRYNLLVLLLPRLEKDELSGQFATGAALDDFVNDSEGPVSDFLQNVEAVEVYDSVLNVYLKTPNSDNEVH